jgi:glycosyltransferase involved in cell wall biosynthesis
VTDSKATSALNLANPLVSIVTPTLQRVGYIEDVLRSVEGQTYRNIEHIVVDGGSSDGTVDLLMQSRRENLRWISEPDGGMYDAINKGLRMSTGQVVAYLNSDDLYFPWSVECAVNALAARPDVDVVYGDIIRRDDIKDWTVPVFTPGRPPASMAAFGSLSQPAVFLRRTVVDALQGFDSHLRYVADLDFWLRAMTQYSFLHLDEFLAFERRHAEMLSETAEARMAIEDEAMRRRYRRGVYATGVGVGIAHVLWLWRASLSWLRFVSAARLKRGGWRSTIAACEPRVPLGTAARGLLPSHFSRFRAGVEWGTDLFDLATARSRGSANARQVGRPGVRPAQ